MFAQIFIHSYYSNIQFLVWEMYESSSLIHSLTSLPCLTPPSLLLSETRKLKPREVK